MDVCKPTLDDLNHFVTRLVVVDHRKDTKDFGRILDIWNIKLKYSWQDNKKTLKIFIKDNNG